MINSRRMFMASAALVAVIMQGCGCSDNDKKYYPPPKKPSEGSFTVTGAASKGVLQNFTATAHLISNNGISSAPIASGLTNDNGAYRLDIPRSNMGQPIVIKVSPASNSRMVCDLPYGCDGDVAFGESMPVPADSNLQLSAIVPSTENSNTVNLSAFTEVATSLALSKMDSGDSLDTIRRYISESNSQVANRFGIQSDLTGLPIIDLTKPNNVRAALDNGNEESVRLAAMNAAIVSAVQSRNDGLSISESLHNFISNYVDRGLAGNTSLQTETSLSDILRASQDVLVKVRDADPERPLSDLSGIVQNLIVQEEMANSEPPNSYDQGTPSDNQGSTALEKVKDMVRDLSDLAVSINETSVGGGSIGVISKEFADQLQAAKLANGDEAGFVLDALAITASVIEEAWSAYGRDNTLETYSGHGVDVAIEKTDASLSFHAEGSVSVTIKGVTKAVDVDVTTGLELASESDALDGSGFGEIDLKETFSIVGVLSSSNVKLEVKPNSTFSIDIRSGEDADSQLVQLLNFGLIVSLSETTEINPVSLNGNLSFTTNNVLMVEDDGDDSQTVTLNGASFRFGGHVANAEGNSFGFAISAEGDARGISFTDGWSSGSSTENNETEEQYANLYGSLSFHADLAGIPNAATLNYNVKRTGLKGSDNSLVIRYGGKSFRFTMSANGDQAQGDLVIVNHQGVTLTLKEVASGNTKRIEGNIKLNGVQYAEVTGSPTITIRYSDGTISSL